MSKKFVKNLFFLILLNVLIKPIWIFGIDRTIQNTVGSEQYGFYFALFNFSMLFNILLDLGITNFNNRNISQNSNLLSKHLSNILVLKLVLGIFYISITLISALIVSYSYTQFVFLIFLSLNQFIQSLILYFRSNLAGLQMFKIDSIISVIDRLLLIIICLLLLNATDFFGEFSIKYLVYGQTLSYFITACIAGIIVISKSEYIKLRFDLVFFIAIIKKSLPFALLVLLMTSYTRIDSIMIERLLPDGQIKAGIYAQSFRILDAVIILAYLFAGLLLPMFSKMLKNKENPANLLRMSFFFLYVPTIIITGISFFYAYDIISLLYIEHVAESYHVFKILMMCFIPFSVSYIFGTLLTANGNLKLLNLTAAFSLVLNVILNIFLIPKFGALGAAYSGLITQFVSSIMQVLISIKIFKLKIKLKTLINLSIFTVIVLFSAFSSSKWIEYRELGFILVVTAGLIAGFIMKIIDVKSVFYLLRQKDEI